MGEDTRGADAGSGRGDGLRAGGSAAGPAAGGALAAGDGTHQLGPFRLTEAALTAWGRRIGSGALRPLVLALHGELGAGKSVLARGVAQGAGVSAHMPSPTFNLVFRYDTPAGPVLHLDLYRLNDPSEVWELGWRELGEQDDVVLIEWPERAAALLPPDRWDIYLAAVAEAPQLRDVRAVRAGDAPSLPAAEPA